MSSSVADSILPGSAQFYRDLTPLIEDRNPKSKLNSLTLLNIEIENLEFVLRTFGPQFRNDTVRSIGNKINCMFKDKGLLYHISTFRFALLFKNSTYDNIQNVIQGLSSTLAESITIAGMTFQIEIKIGVSHFPNHADNLYDLVKAAAFACHLARIDKVLFSIYSNERAIKAQHKFRLLSDLEAVLIDGKELRLVYQPIVDLQNQTCVHAEGLCRWNHHELGNVSPNDFIPDVEQSSLIGRFTEFTLGQGLDFCKQLSSSFPQFSVAINLSASMFRNQNLLMRLQEIFSFNNIDFKQVLFEITESSIIENPKLAILMLENLKLLGCKIAIDDFGTGHSSLAYLASMPIDIIKIDKCFIQELENKKYDAIVRTTVFLAEKLGIQTVAEGIENEIQLEICKSMGINYGQGYHIACPMEKDDFEEWLTTRFAKTDNIHLIAR